MKSFCAGIFLMCAIAVCSHASISRVVGPLTPVQQHRADSVYANFKIVACNSLTLSALAKSASPCPIAAHLTPFVHWLAGIDTTSALMAQDMEKRITALSTDSTVTIDTTFNDFAGEKSSPVSIVLYVLLLVHCVNLCSEKSTNR